MINLYFSTLLFCFILFSCGQTQVSNQTHDSIKAINLSDANLNKSLLIDTTKIAILPIDTANVWVFKDAVALQLTNRDLQRIDILLTECINANNNKQDTTKRVFEYINLKNYKRQYVPFIDSKGEKKVYINCFCLSDSPDEFNYWKKSLVEVDDGGSCFFHLTVNLSSGQYGQLFINGYG